MGILRFFLAFSILIQHSGGHFGLGGGTAVEIFFIISGFYMGLILCGGKYQDYSIYISNRFLRIFPIYWVMLLLTLLVAGILMLSGFSIDKTALSAYHSFGGTLGFFPWIFFVISNLFIYAQEWTLFLGLEEGAFFLTENFTNTSPMVYSFLLIPQAWSLSVELLFYLIAPLLVWQKKFNVNYLLIFLALLSLACKIMLLTSGFPYDPWAYRFFPSLLYQFLMGILAYKFYSSSILQHLRRKHIIYILFGFVLIMLIYYGALQPFKKQMQSDIILHLSPLQAEVLKIIKMTLKFTFRAVLQGLIICCLFYLTSKNRLDRWIGELSYPLYVCHLTVIGVLSLFLTRDLYFPYYISVISIFLSILLVHWVQKPVEHYRELRLKNQPSKKSTYMNGRLILDNIS